MLKIRGVRNQRAARGMVGSMDATSLDTIMEPEYWANRKVELRARAKGSGALNGVAGGARAGATVGN